MKLQRILLCLIWLVMPFLVSAQEEPVRVSALELMRRGKQVSVHLRTSRPPVYEVAENLAAKTIVIKFKNTLFDFKDGRKETGFVTYTPRPGHPDDGNGRFIDRVREVSDTFNVHDLTAIDTNIEF